MQKAGGIVALIAGIFGFFAAIFTLMIGGIGNAFNSEHAPLVVNLGLGGILFSFACIILGAVAMSAKTRLPAALLIMSAVAGALLGGTFVAVCMALALVGGILATVGAPGDDVRSNNTAS
jgi:hypothetical protein